MKKMFNKYVFSIIIFIVVMLINNKVHANSIKSIDMDVYIDKKGNATITEVWKGKLSTGTEGYRTFSKLDKSVISNFSVVDETGKNYESVSSWNVNDTFDEKAYKCGINENGKDIELCWGISKYGDNTYTLKYNISNMVTQYKDKQGIYFNFINLDQTVSDATIKIHSDTKFSVDNSKIWAFGNDGTINFVNGDIVLSSKGTLSKSQYMVALVKFESDIFKTSNNSGKIFDDIYKSAMRGTEKERFLDFVEKNDAVIALVAAVISTFLVTFAFMKIGKKCYRRNLKDSTLNFENAGRVIPSDKEINYWREIPCNKSLKKAFWLCVEYSIIKEEDLKQGIVGAILLKWIKEGKIALTKTKNGLFNIKDNNYAIDFSHLEKIDDVSENRLLGILKRAAGENQILEPKEFKKWCKKNYFSLDIWFSDVKRDAKKEFINDKLITETEKEYQSLFGSTSKRKICLVDPQLREEAIKLKGLKKFLLDFSMLPEREYIEVNIWEEYLIFAELLGIADKVAEQFRKIYPNFDQESVLNTSVTTYAIRNMSETGYKGMEKGLNRASIRSAFLSGSGSDRSSGGGGSSYSGGGSSAGGSSGGGFR